MIARGGAKKVLDAVCLNNSNPYIWAKVSKSQGILHTKREIEYLTLFHKMQNLFVIDPYVSTLEVKDKNHSKLILIQHKYTSDGSALTKATTENLMLAFIQIAQGLAHMHASQFVHMDVKLSNILIDGNYASNQAIVARLGDFGVTRRSQTQIIGGTLPNLPPEVLLAKRYSCQAKPEIDSFSLGITMIEALVKSSSLTFHYFNQYKQEEVDCYISQIQQALSNQVNLNTRDIEVRQNLQKICHGLIQTEPLKRLSCQEVAKRLQQLHDYYFSKDPKQ
jgi:serine/threonine protein kinase